MRKNSGEKDWRIRNQKEYLLHASISLQTFISSEKWSHEHCEFCWKKFCNNDLGYCTQDGRFWICEECYTDFKDEFLWNLLLR